LGDYFNKKLNEVGKKRILLKRQTQKLNNEIAELKKQLTTSNSSSEAGKTEIAINVQSLNATMAVLSVTYVADNAGWSPFYDFRANGLRNGLQMAYKAHVFQNTGVDWKNVQLSLSSTNPVLGGTKPEISPEYLTIFEPIIPKPTSRKSKNEVADSDGFSALAEEVVVERPRAMAAPTMAESFEVVKTTIATKFDLKIPYSISKNGTPETVDIQNSNIPTKFELGAVPKYDTDAFLVAKIFDWSKFNLISGKANVYLDGSFVGETFINTENLEDTLKISMGRDKKVLVKREEIEEFKNSKQSGSTIKMNKTFKITVRNTKNEAVRIILEDQIPVSQDSKIEVELTDGQGAIVDAQTGKLTWDLQFNPNENKEIIVKYLVKYPKDKKVLGL
jgi:uncharacterized protein (TIGR02231 family)